MWLPFGIVTLLLGCGEIGGSGQCFGVDATGMCLTIDSIQPTDTVTGFGDTSDVDIFQNPDCDLSTPEFETEAFGGHSADVSFTAALLEGVSSPPAPAFMTFETYTIEYVASPANTVTTPVLTTQFFSANSLKINADSSITATFEFVPIPTKDEYNSGGGDPSSVAIYTAFYTFQGKSQFNQDVVLKGSAGFNLGNFDNCP